MSLMSALLLLHYSVFLWLLAVYGKCFKFIIKIRESFLTVTPWGAAGIETMYLWSILDIHFTHTMASDRRGAYMVHDIKLNRTAFTHLSADDLIYITHEFLTFHPTSIHCVT